MNRIQFAPGAVGMARQSGRISLYKKEVAPVDSFATSYNYSTPLNASTPTDGQIQHGDNILNMLLISKVDAGAVARLPQAIKAGYTIAFNSATYTVTTDAEDHPTYAVVRITPSVQQPDGNYVITVTRP